MEYIPGTQNMIAYDMSSLKLYKSKNVHISTIILQADYKKVLANRNYRKVCLILALQP